MSIEPGPIRHEEVLRLAWDHITNRHTGYHHGFALLLFLCLEESPVGYKYKVVFPPFGGIIVRVSSFQLSEFGMFLIADPGFGRAFAKM